MPTTEKTLPKRGIHDWTSRDHDKSCPRHHDFDETKLAELVREHLRLPPKDKLPERSKWPVMPCIEKEGTCCPPDLVVNASNRPIIIGATGIEEIARDTPRVDPGDRRQGEYYVRQIGLPLALGLQRVRDLPMGRLVDLEKTRQVRTGERAPDWVLIARKRAAEGKGPPVFQGGKGEAMTALQAAAGEQYLGAFGDDIFGQRV